ncbi:DNA damage-inducible transcript 4-like protein [Aulostomus maculatus]
MVYTPALPFGRRVLAPSSEEDSVMDMIGKYFFLLPARNSPARDRSARRGSVESYDETDKPYLHLDAGLEHKETLLQQEVTQQIERCLTEAKASTLHCQVLLLPRQMTARVYQDVVRSSADEPCGLRGASIRVYVEGRDSLKPLGNICVDPSVTPTFELSVVFKVDKGDGWPPLKHIFDSSKVMKLRPEYRLVKKKLYSSASPVIHEFS